MIGGFDDDKIYNDVWKSQNGIDWININQSTVFGQRMMHRMFVYDDQIYMYGGKGKEGILNDCYRSKEGTMWNKVELIFN